MTRQQAKNLGEYVGIFFVTCGLWLLFFAYMRILVDVARWLDAGGVL